MAHFLCTPQATGGTGKNWETNQISKGSKTSFLHCMWGLLPPLCHLQVFGRMVVTPEVLFTDCSPVTFFTASGAFADVFVNDSLLQFTSVDINMRFNNFCLMFHPLQQLLIIPRLPFFGAAELQILLNALRTVYRRSRSSWNNLISSLCQSDLFFLLFFSSQYTFQIL